MDIFMLLDRTGSMQGRWDEAVSSVNAYVEQVRTGTRAGVRDIFRPPSPAEDEGLIEWVRTTQR